ncbi:hypothetical protein J3F84DRAFT_378165 [Trichoderma pleuroticola]|uniref:Uncharacterized protein n=1 Tax=Trichoderma harzianum TaxID=5544 RepID=A0A2K0U0N6_TRIHA|nr:hypothetical protein THARTR1_08004 [Trichoderma harzianum]
MTSTLHLRKLPSTSFIRTSIRPFHQSIPRLIPAIKQEGDSKPEHPKNSTVPQPKISNLSMPGVNKSEELTKEQKEEVRQHNKDFEKKFDHGHTAPDDKVDKKFWQGAGSKE